MAEDNWQQARLIPTSGINGQEEAERRATSALLAVMGSVRDFGMAIVKPFGAPASDLATFIEVPFRAGERTIYPDGLIEATRGNKTWTALVEVKTGAAVLERAQLESYLDVAKEAGFDAVVTISNQIAPAPGVHPVEVDKRRTRKVALHHLSWAEVLTIAVMERVHRGVSDPEQAWILEELIRYLEHPKSGAFDFGDMGSSWVSIRDAVASETLRANDKGLADVVSRWEQLLRFAALRLGRELGTEVQVHLTRKETEDPAFRFAAVASSLVSEGQLSGSIKIKDAIAPLDVYADLRAGRVTVSADVAAPREGRPTTRVNWIVRQLRSAPDGLRIDAFAANARTSTSELLRTVRENPNALIADRSKELRTFRVAAMSALGSKRGTGSGSFIDSVLVAIDGFYESTMQQLQPWAAKAPKMVPGRSATEAAGIETRPPPKDLTEPTEASPNIDEPAPAVVERAVELSNELAPETSHAARPRAGELVSWDDASDRLDHERAHQSPSTSDGG